MRCDSIRRALGRALTTAFVTALALVAARAAEAAPCTTECWVDAVNGSDANEGTGPADAFLTLQKAIDTVTAGGTVRAAPGLYDPNFTTVTKSVTLLGAQAGVDPLTRDPNDATAESIVQSNTGFRITGASAVVTIDGFVFKEKTVGLSFAISTGTGGSDVGATVTVESNVFSSMNGGIGSSFGTNPSSFAISGNLWSGGKNAISMQGDRGAATLVIDSNRFANLTGTAIFILVWTGAEITNNTVQSQTGSQDPIQVGGCHGCRIAGNTIASSGGFESISLIGSDGPSVDSVIEDNVITSPTRSDNYGIYIGIATGTTIRRNTITGAREAGIATDPASSVLDNQITSAGGAGTVGIYLRRASTGSTVTGNTITGAAVGIDIDPQAGSTSTHVNRNAIDGNTAGLTNRAAALADATCNWWGAASGPGGQGPGSGDPVSANVTFSPWLLGDDLENATCGPPATPTPTPSPTPTPTPTATPLPEVCDNCVDDDGDGLVDRDDDGCPARADGGGAGLGSATRAKAAVKCQKAIGSAGTSFTLGKQKLLAACVAGLTKCVQEKPGDVGCVQKAAVKCTKAIAKLPALEAKLDGAVRKACGDPALAAADLLAVEGVGFAAEAASCAAAGVASLASAAEVALCVARRDACTADRLLGTEAPRTRELLVLAGIDPGDFGCLASGADGGGQGIGAPARAKLVTKCAAGLPKAVATYVKQHVTLLQGCVQKVAQCVQQKPADPKCLPKAEAACAKLEAKLDGPKGARVKATAAIAKACAGDVADVLAATGVGQGSTAGHCAALGVASLATIADVAECVVRDHACRAGQLLETAIPRAAELLELGGLVP